MKISILLLLVFCFKINFLSGKITIIPKTCDCENDYFLNSGNLSANSVKFFQVYLFFLPKESNATTLSKTCHAIVLDKSWLLSVADCVKANDLKKNNILVGIPSNENKFVDFLDFVNKSNTYTIEEILIHPNYSDTEPLENQLPFDFALLKLKTSFKKNVFLKTIKPACLSLSKFIPRKRNEFFFVTGDSSLKSPCHLTQFNLTREKLVYSSFNEFKFITENCQNEKLYCFSSEDSESCLTDSGNILYQKKEEKIIVVGQRIKKSFYPYKYKPFSNCYKSSTSYFIYFYYAINWIEQHIQDVLCKVLVEEKENKDLKNTLVLKKLRKIEKKCGCEYKELFDYIGNNSFFDEKKYTKRFNSPKKYFRHLVQIVKHNMHDVLDPYRFICTGVVINENFVITTAECANKTELNNLYIYFGLKSLEGIEKIDSFFTSYTSKVLEQIFHPFHIPDSGMFYNDLQILRTKLPIEERPDLLNPACFANEKELEKQADDRLLIASFMLLGNFQNRVVDINKKSNIEFIISNYITDYYHQGVDQCDSLICVPTPIYADLGSEGTPLHRFTEYSMEVSGLMKKNVLPVFYKLHRFVPLTYNMVWIKLVVGQFDYCERNELNRFFSKKICKCDYSVSNLLEPNPLIASIIAYEDKTANSKNYVCKSVIINEFWVLTTYNCFNKTFFEAEHYYISLNTRAIGKHTKTDFLEIEGSGITYPVKKIVLNDKLKLALVKSKEKLLLGKYTDKYAGCFYREERIVDFSKSLLLESFVQNVQAKYESKCNCVFFNSEICLENEGSPISLIDDWVESTIVGLLSVHSIIDYELDFECTFSSQKHNNFIPVQNSIKWLSEVVGENNYCHLENHFFDHKKCSCQDQNIVSIVSSFLIDQIQYYLYVCRGVVVNEFWVLTTATCVHKKTDLFININSKFELNLTFSIEEENQDKFVKYILFIYIHPNFKEKENEFGDFKNKEFNLALIRLQQPLDLDNNPNLEASCFMEKSIISNYVGFYSRIRSLENSLALWKEFTSEDYAEIKIFKKNPKLLSLKFDDIVCKYDQGEPVRKKMPLGIMTIGLMSDLDYRYAINYQKHCFKSIINIGVKVNIEDTWFKNKVEAHGICIYEKFHEFKFKNRCQCDAEGRYPGFNLGQRIFNGTKQNNRQKNYFKFMVFVSYFNNKFFNTFIHPYHGESLNDYYFLSSAVIISNKFILTAKSPFWKINQTNYRYKIKVIGIHNYFAYKNNLDGSIILDQNEVFKVVKSYFIENTLLILLRVDIHTNFNYMLRRFVKAPCLTFFEYKNFSNGKLIGVGFGSTESYEIFDDKSQFWSKKRTSQLSNFYNFVEFTTDFTEVLKRNPKANLTCENKNICVTSHGTISKYDVGGPLLFINKKTIELVGIMTVENDQIPEPYEIFKFTRLSYYEKKLKSITNNNIDCQSRAKSHS